MLKQPGHGIVFSQTLGRSGIDELIKQLCQNAKLFETELSKHNFRILNDVVFNQVLVACETPELTLRTLKYIQESGECWCGSSQWYGEPVIRISVCSWKTTSTDVVRTVEAFVHARKMARD